MEVPPHLLSRLRLFPGKCIVRLDHPATLNSLLIPESSRGPRLETGSRIRESNTVYTGTLLASTPGKNEDTIPPGTRVVVALLAENLDQHDILTTTNRVQAILEPEPTEIGSLQNPPGFLDHDDVGWI